MHDAVLVGVVHGPGERLDQFGRLARQAGVPRRAWRPGRRRRRYSRAKYGWPSCSPRSWICTMLGCCNRATASASVWKRCARLGGRMRAAQDHLQGDDAVELDLPGLVDNAHSAAVQLAEDFVTRDGRLIRARRRGPEAGRNGQRRGTPQRPGQPARVQRGKPRLVILRARLLTAAAAAGDVRLNQLLEQFGTFRLGCIGQEVFDPGALHGVPGVREALAGAWQTRVRLEGKRFVVRPIRRDHLAFLLCPGLKKAKEPLPHSLQPNQTAGRWSSIGCSTQENERPGDFFPRFS